MRISDWSSDVYSSDLAAVARHLPAGPEAFHVEPLLAEQDFGGWQGLTYAELAAGRSGAWHRFWLAPAEEVPPGGESFAALAARVATAIDALTRRTAGRDIVCVSHRSEEHTSELPSLMRS